MSEQLANLYGNVVSSVPISSLIPSVTLAAPYVAGAGQITVSSATGAPTGGTFSLTIFNAQTGAVYLIFRVTSVAGAVFTGAAEGPDANAPLGAAVVGTMLTVAAINQIKADAAAGAMTPSQMGIAVPLADPTALTWTTFSPTGLTLTPLSKAINAAAVPSGGNIIQGQHTPIVSIPYHAVIGFTANVFAATFAQIGMVISDGTNFIIIRFPKDVGTEDIFTWNGTSSPGSALQQINTVPVMSFYAPALFLRIRNDGVTRTFEVSNDGLNFIPLFSHAAGTFLTETSYGFFVLNNSGSAVVAMTVIHAKQTNP